MMRWLDSLRKRYVTGDADFDEAAYLQANPDVRAAVASGQIKSGYEHYRQVGRLEGRLLDDSGGPRRPVLLDGVDPHSSSGLEIGALDKPLVRKSEGNVTYVDYADTAFLKAHYANDANVDCDRIIEVDAIWGSNTLRQAVGEHAWYDYVVASHVIEHIPDLVTWLQEIRSILRETGSLRLAVPDKRYTFDYCRQVSSMPDVLDAHVRRARAPLPRMILDFCMQVRHVDTIAAWRRPLQVSALQRHFTDQDALAIARDAFESGKYHDVHCWVFTPRSFCDVMAHLSEMGLTDFACHTLVPTPRNSIEFYVHMAPAASPAEARSTWMNLPSLRERRRA